MIKVFGQQEQQTINQMETVMGKLQASYGVLCADAHLGYSVPVGGVVALEDSICVNAVGFDIACGNAAVLLDAEPKAVKENIYRTMNEIQSKISFGVGRKNKERVDDDVFYCAYWDEIDILKSLKDKAYEQLGTVGSGNHYVDLFTDEEGRIWCGVHFGSRGLGHSICKHFIKLAGGQDGIHADPVVLKADSDLGEQYLKCMELAGEYAYAGRDWVCDKLAQILRCNILKGVHNHHNFAWRENHFGKDYWVIRKGATPAFPGQLGFVGGSMGDISVIIEGKKISDSFCPTKDQEQSLYSTIHGAGRILGRAEAKGRRHRKTGKLLSEPKVDRKAHEEWMKNKGVELRGGDLDESPYCYKRIEEVLEAHSNTIDILHVLNPIGVCMASSREYDPYKD